MTRLAGLVGQGQPKCCCAGANSPEEALQIGLAQFVVNDDRLMIETEAIVDDILAKSPSAVRLTWEALHRGLNLTLEESTSLGADFFELLASTEDFRIGTKAFVEKAKPRFVGYFNDSSFGMALPNS